MSGSFLILCSILLCRTISTSMKSIDDEYETSIHDERSLLDEGIVDIPFPRPLPIPCIGCDTCPGRRYNDGCNNCFCDENGESICTKKFCRFPRQPFCRPDCSAVSCAVPNCGPKQRKIKPRGSCCQICVDKLKKCRRRFCEEPECGINEVAVWTPEQCCKKCVTAVCTEEPPSCIGCDTCPNGFNDGCNDCICDEDGNAACTRKSCFVQGQPFCKADCSAVLCAVPQCGIGQIEVTLAGECCPTCVQLPGICPAFCPPLTCAENEIGIRLPGDCCPSCAPGLCDTPTCIGCDTCPSGEYNDGCNECSCDENGNTRCTELACITFNEPFCKPDCSAILCANPVCPEGQTKIVPAGECCPTCIDDPDCSAVSCLKPQCLEDEVIVTKPGQCCPECVPGICELPTPPTPECIGCDTCPRGAFNDGCNDCECDGNGNADCTEKSCLVQGQPFCQPDCSAVLCINPLCGADETIITPAGQCCPVCIKDPCPEFPVLCATPNCKPNEIAVTTPDSCCPVCVPGLCEIPPTCIGCDTCPNGFNDGCNNCICDENGNAACTKKLCLEKGEPFCKPDCSAVSCVLPLCQPGFKNGTKAGKCCPGCIPDPDCTLVRCALPVCLEGEIAVTKEGECCPTCVPALCDNEPSCIGCESCPRGEYFDGCNDCTCNSDGSSVCSEKACLVSSEPFCKPDCSAVSCLLPECTANQTLITPAGACCPTCIENVDCTETVCTLDVCPPDTLSVIRPGECCKTCVTPTCPKIEPKNCIGCDTCPGGYIDGCNTCSCEDGIERCTLRACNENEITKPFCNPDCFLVGCPALNCGINDTISKPPGECCEKCISQRDCSRIICDVLQCLEGEISIIEDGECCPICVPGLCPITPNAMKELSRIMNIASKDNNIIIIAIMFIIGLIIIGIGIGIFIRKCWTNKSLNKGYHTISKQNITSSDITDDTDNI